MFVDGDRRKVSIETSLLLDRFHVQDNLVHRIVRNIVHDRRNRDGEFQRTLPSSARVAGNRIDVAAERALRYLCIFAPSLLFLFTAFSTLSVYDRTISYEHVFPIFLAFSIPINHCFSSRLTLCSFFQVLVASLQRNCIRRRTKIPPDRFIKTQILWKLRTSTSSSSSLSSYRQSFSTNSSKRHDRSLTRSYLRSLINVKFFVISTTEDSSSWELDYPILE